MGLEGDPGKWIVVALIACAHLTFLIFRRSHGKFTWKSFGSAIVVCWLAGCCCFLPITWTVGTHNQTAWQMLPMLCGVFLASRASTLEYRVGAAFAGILATVAIISFGSYVASTPEYIGGQPRWTILGDGPSPAQVADNFLEESDKKVIPKGYITTTTVSSKTPKRVPVYNRTSPVPLWHSAISGIYGRSHRFYRLWTPGGNPKAADAGALLVPVGTPPGKESETGVEINSEEWRDALFEVDSTIHID